MIARLQIEQSALLIVDIQEKLLPPIPQKETLLRDLAFLIDVARLLGVPVLATEQYPRGLGPTVPELASRLPEPRPDKLAFSCCGCAEVPIWLDARGRSQVVVAGMETHVCILQTALDLLADERQVFLPVDALRGRLPLDHDVALRRMERAGAVLTSCEAIAFEWLRSAEHPQFKTVSRMIVERFQSQSRSIPANQP